MLEVTTWPIDGVLTLTPKRHGDARGYFSETYNAQRFAAAGVEHAFVQDNQSLSVDVGVVRGLHFQTPPHAQAKLIRVLRGRILDVVVDIRRGSPTFGQHVAVELSADNGLQLLAPVGVAHGFVTREPNTEVLYKTTDYYAPNNDAGVLWSDPGLQIDWGINPDMAILSSKDQDQPLLKNYDSPFVYEPAP